VVAVTEKSLRSSLNFGSTDFEGMDGSLETWAELVWNMKVGPATERGLVAGYKAASEEKVGDWH
jgi:hypothetical protein